MINNNILTLQTFIISSLFIYVGFSSTTVECVMCNAYIYIYISMDHNNNNNLLCIFKVTDYGLSLYLII